MTESLICSDCGSSHVEKGIFQYDAKIEPLEKAFSTGSVVLVDLCTDCGLILKMKVREPEKFK